MINRFAEFRLDENSAPWRNSSHQSDATMHSCIRYLRWSAFQRLSQKIIRALIYWMQKGWCKRKKLKELMLQLKENPKKVLQAIIQVSDTQYQDEKNSELSRSLDSRLGVWPHIAWITDKAKKIVHCIHMWPKQFFCRVALYLALTRFIISYSLLMNWRNVTKNNWV